METILEAHAEHTVDVTVTDMMVAKKHAETEL
jgi:hypothetical protein